MCKQTKKLVQQHISQALGKVVTLTDLSNVRAQIDDQSTKGSELETVVKDLTAMNGKL